MAGTRQELGAVHLTELRRAFRDSVRQEVMQLSVSFPVIVLRYVEPVHKWGGGEMPGVLQARARVRPKYKRMIAPDGREVEMPEIFWVPVSWWRVGDAVFKFAPKKGQIMKCTISDKALEDLLRDKQPAHFGPNIERQFGVEDAILEPFGVRTEDEPYLPAEFLKDPVYIAIVKQQDNQLIPISKFVMRGLDAPVPGEIRFECPRFVVLSPDVHLGDIGGPNVVRVGDRDDDTEANGRDRMVEGSNVTFCATSSRYRPGLSPDNDAFSQGLAAQHGQEGVQFPVVSNSEFSQFLQSAFDSVQNVFSDADGGAVLNDIIDRFWSGATDEQLVEVRDFANAVGTFSSKLSEQERAQFFWDQARKHLPAEHFPQAVVDTLQAKTPQEALDVLEGKMRQAAPQAADPDLGRSLLAMANTIFRSALGGGN